MSVFNPSGDVGSSSEDEDVFEKEMVKFQKTIEEKEKRDVANLEISLNKDGLRRLLSETQDAGHRDMLERFIRLPDKIEFKPGINLIIGDNGGGKSTLAKALFLAMKVDQTADSLRKCAYESDAFRQAQTTSQETVFNPRGNRWELMWIHQAGLAAEIAKNIEITDAHSADSVEYCDIPEIIGEVKSRQQEDVRDIKELNVMQRHREQGLREIASKEGRAYEGTSTPVLLNVQIIGEVAGQNKGRSHRQTIDSILFDKMYNGRVKKEGKPYIHFLDEPEAGASPWVHEKLEGWIDTVTDINPQKPKSIVITPTNSVVLYMSGLPRIDLRYPEKGIHVPDGSPDES